MNIFAVHNWATNEARDDSIALTKERKNFSFSPRTSLLKRTYETRIWRMLYWSQSRPTTESTFPHKSTCWLLLLIIRWCKRQVYSEKTRVLNSSIIILATVSIYRKISAVLLAQDKRFYFCNFDKIVKSIEIKALVCLQHHLGTMEPVFAVYCNNGKYSDTKRYLWKIIQL